MIERLSKNVNWKKKNYETIQRLADTYGASFAFAANLIVEEWTRTNNHEVVVIGGDTIKEK